MGTANLLPIPTNGDWLAIRRGFEILNLRLGCGSNPVFGTATFDDLTLLSPVNIYALSHDSFADFVANEHINHDSVEIIAGTGLTGGGKITGNVTLNCLVSQYTDEEAQDAVGGILDNGTVGNVVFTYDDVTPLISAVVQDGEIDHNSLSNTHNLTTDIDHDQLTNFSSDEHFLQTEITNISTALSTGLVKVTTGTGALSVIADDSSNWNTAYGWGNHADGGYFVTASDTLDDILTGITNVHLTTTLKGNYDDAYSHISSSGVSHSYIDQNVTTTGNPTFNYLNLPSTTGDNVGTIKVNSTVLFNFYGTGNLFVGASAGNYTLTGSYNTAIGPNALKSLTSGSYNFAFGSAALRDLENGTGNVGLGPSALMRTTSGNYNFGIGTNALQWNNTGGSNVAIGFQAGAGTSAQSKSNNVLIGFQSAYVGSGNNNVAIGYRAGLSLAAGIGNTLLGYQAGDNLTSASYCIILGYDIDAPSATANYQLSIGGIVRGNTNDREVYLACPDTIAADANLLNGEVTFAVDETSAELDIKVKYSDGTVKSGVVSLS